MIHKMLCWLGFHDWQCVYRKQWEHTDTQSTAWRCFRPKCDKHRYEQWDN